MSEPSSATVAVADMATHLRITGSADNAYLTALEAAAARYCEQYCNRAFVTQSWKAVADEFPDETPGDFPEAFLIRLGDLISVTSLKYYDTDGVEQTLSSSEYIVDRYADRIRITPAYGEVWPTAQERAAAITITLSVGYGAASAVPEIIKSAIKLLAAHWYENREAVITGTTVAETPFAVKAILDQFVIH